MRERSQVCKKEKDFLLNLDFPFSKLSFVSLKSQRQLIKKSSINTFLCALNKHMTETIT